MEKLKKFKKVKKYIIASVIGIIVLIFNFFALLNTVYAVELGGSVNLQKICDCGSLLKYKGIPVVTTYVASVEGENVYPAYCLNSNLLGVGETGSYTVSTENLVTDVRLWRRVINGYPYKSISELGCQTKEEAFTATKHAIYCYIHNNNPDNYSAIGEAGERTLNAMRQIISNAENSTETKMQTSITINKNISTWKQDDIDKKYVSKIYEVEANADYKTYTISIGKGEKTNLPEGIKIANIYNNEQNIFSKGEKFKVLIPINNLNNNGDFILNVKAEMNTKPVLYGRAPSSNLQDYAITVLKYEDGIGSIKDEYGENTTKIVVYKQEKNTKKPLEGVSFDLLDSNKKVIKTELKTDKEGKVIIKGIMPGKYYLKEVKALDGYVKYDEEIEIEVALNEEVSITVNNSRETKIEVEKTQKKVEVTQKLGKKAIGKKLPVTGM